MTDILEKCSGLISTQLNESFHDLKAKFTDKDPMWIDSWPGRVCAAVLQFNQPNIWKLELYQRLKLPPLATHNMEMIL